MFQHIDWENFVITIIVLVISITLHEFGHAYSADRLGDDTPRRQGRVTLWPDKHFDPFGFGMMVLSTLFGYGLGWGKPVMVDFRNFRNVRRDDIIVTACGPLMNLLLALVFGLMLRVMIANGNESFLDTISGKFALTFLFVNLSLMCFNLIPIYPLDGSHILRRLLPVDAGETYYNFVRQWGPIMIMLLVFSGSGILGRIISPAVMHLARLIVG